MMGGGMGEWLRNHYCEGVEVVALCGVTITEYSQKAICGQYVEDNVHRTDDWNVVDCKKCLEKRKTQ